VKLFRQNWDSGAKEQQKEFWRNGALFVVLTTLFAPPNACVEILAELMSESPFWRNAVPKTKNRQKRDIVMKMG
jgi:hypothetical protein